MKLSAHAAFRRRFALVGTAWIALAPFHAGCGDPRDAADVWPDGAWIVARTDALVAILTKLEELEGTPLARSAAARRGTLPTCATLEAIGATPEFGDALGRLACAGESSPLSKLRPELESSDLLFSLPFGDGGGKMLRGRGTIDSNGEIALELTLPQNALEGLFTLLIPGNTPPGPAQLNRDGQLVHARIRPEGALDIASLISDGDQADRLFRLKSRLFAGTVLDGSWETAIYLPAPGSRMPRAALALGVSHRAPAVIAMEEFIAELQRAWPVHRTAFAVAEAEGACLLDLNILPELAPCYVASGNALIAGWNSASVRHALAKRPGEQASSENALVIELDRFPQADALLAAAALPYAEPASVPTPAREHPTASSVTAPFPWRRVVAERVPGDLGVTIELTFESGAGA